MAQISIAIVEGWETVMNLSYDSECPHFVVELDEAKKKLNEKGGRIARLEAALKEKERIITELKLRWAEEDIRVQRLEAALKDINSVIDTPAGKWTSDTMFIDAIWDVIEKHRHLIEPDRVECITCKNYAPKGG